MQGGSLIAKTDYASKNDKIKKTIVDENLPVYFNLKNLRNTEKKFDYTSLESQYFIKFIERLKNIGSMSRKELINHWDGAVKCHRIEFNEPLPKITEKSFGCGSENDENAFQFSISKNKWGRVHGYFIDNIFYIVWLDPNHELYPGKK